MYNVLAYMIAVVSSFPGGKVTTLFRMPCQLPHGKFEIYEMFQTADNPLITETKAQYPMENFYQGHGK